MKQMESVTLKEEEAEEGLAIAALGSLFKLTEVHLSDYSSWQILEPQLFLESSAHDNLPFLTCVPRKNTNKAPLPNRRNELDTPLRVANIAEGRPNSGCIKLNSSNATTNLELRAVENQLTQPVSAQRNETYDGTQTWANLVHGNRLASRGMKLHYVAPTIRNGQKIVELSGSEVEKETEKWKQAVILYVVGYIPTVGSVERFIATQWNFILKPKVLYHDDGYFVIRFYSMEDRDAVLYSGPHTISNKPVITKVWSPELVFNDEILKTIPLWKPVLNSDVYKNNASPLNEFGSLPEDWELIRQMNEMGLPISFHTNKEKKNRAVQKKIKNGKKMSLWSCENTQDEALNSIQEQKEECESNGTLQGNSNKVSSSMSILEQSEFSSCYTEDGVVNCLNGGEESLNKSSAGCAHTSLECAAYNWQSDLSLDNAKDSVSTCEKVQLIKDVVVMVDSSLECGNNAESCPIDNSVDSGRISGVGLNGHCERNPLNGEQMEYACIGNPLNGEQEESIAMQTTEHHTEDGKLCSDVGEELHNCNTTSTNCEETINDWRFYWDNDYQRNYFYNVVTMQCTWDPPPGMDDLVFTNFTTKQPETALETVELEDADLKESNNLQTSASIQSDLDIAGGFGDDEVLLDRQLNDSEGTGQFADNFCSLSSTKQKKRVRKTKFKGKLSIENQELQFCDINEEISPSLSKYWCQRYLLFNKYDEGIQMDEEGWFSVTPEAIAKHHALRCGSGTIVDLFTGVGGNSIQFAKRSKHVIAIDIDPKRIDFAQCNAAIYGVCDQIDFIRGDSLVLAPKLKADVVFMSPPWGGPDYLKERTFDMKTMLRPHDGNFLFSVGRGIASKVVMFLPRNVDINQLAELSLSVNPPWLLEVEKNYLNGKLKAITAYFCKPS